MRFIFVASALNLASIASAVVSSSGQTVVVNGISYYASPDPVSIIDATADMLSSSSTSGVDLIPLTVMADTSSSFTTSVFRTLVGNYTASDDVFNTGFLQAIYLNHVGSGPATVKYPLGAALTEYGTKLFMPARAYTSSVESQGYSFTGWRTEVAPGPYFMSALTGELFQAYRLYSDIQGAFTDGLIPSLNGDYSILSAAVPGAQSLTIGVPSRLYYTKTAAQPLAGVRVGVKDIFDIAGVKSSLGNRAYYELYPARTVTASSVQRLIDAGAVIIGKMKTSQFANGETATDDWPWIRHWGSIRNPSQVNGCFGNRPSHGLVPLDGVMPLSPALDTAGFLTRDPLLWHAAAKVLYSTNITSSNYKTFPKKIITSGFPTTATTEAQTVLLAFLSKLETFLGSTSTTALNIPSLWASTTPAAANGDGINDYLNIVYPVLISQQQYSLLTLPFYADYAAANSGKRPFIDPSPLIRWTWGQTNVSASATDEAITNKTVFMEWWQENVVLPSNESCSESILLYPGSLASPTYRNVYRSAPGVPTGFSISRVSNFAEVPDMVFPIGQASYQSTITLQSEMLPVAVDIMVAKGCDGMVFDLAEKLLAAGILGVPKTGSLTF
ncbi:Scytalone deHydratase Arp1 [Hyphodiscus hymeniophilus]|uniref:Scytalone deHydratase Arp1 n=1 Tax=Hyphodiscus hymeniophilus TaxID=353542 RepID=A0A9P6VMW4_9HELO|nr:Scytalone deHydratase Arp1 [Hyphodiscus hymeniophilus]